MCAAADAAREVCTVGTHRADSARSACRRIPTYSLHRSLRAQRRG